MNKTSKTESRVVVKLGKSELEVGNNIFTELSAAIERVEEIKRNVEFGRKAHIQSGFKIIIEKTTSITEIFEL